MSSLSGLVQSKYFLVVFIICNLISFDLLAEKIKSPEFIEGVELVRAEEVLSLISYIDDLVVIDSRIRGDRHKGYLESSVSLPDTETNCKSLEKIIPNKNHHTLFYCNGVKCGRSALAINIAKECGYTMLYWFRGGFESWLEKGFPFVKE